MAKTESILKEKPADCAPDSKAVNVGRSFAVAALTAIVPATMTGALVVPATINTSAVYGLFTGVCTLFAGLAAHTLADAKLGPKAEEGYNKKAVFSGLFIGLAAAGLLTWQLNADDAEQTPVAPAQPSSAAVTLMPHMKPVTSPKFTYPSYAPSGK